MDEQILIQHRFTINESPYPSFSDAIVLPLAEYEALTPDDIENIKSERFANFKNMIDNPPPPAPEPPVEDVIAALVDQRDDITAQIEQLQQQEGQ